MIKKPGHKSTVSGKRHNHKHRSWWNENWINYARKTLGIKTKETLK